MKEIRMAEIRTDRTQDKNNTLIGIPIVFDKPTVINSKYGSYTEIIKRDAINNELLKDIPLLYNHDVNSIPLARSPQTMNLIKTDVGIEMRATLSDTPMGKEIYSSVSRGDIKGMSFAFQVPNGGDEYDAETNTRTINKIEKLYEVSVTPFPAYAETSVEARSGYMCKRNIQAQKAKAKVNKILGSQLKNKVNQILKRGK
ncbi:HK97 family phage prohead protease [Clostridium tyrobutyricum]|uniref:HK97 family phage prohead protease n=1 Tax=Clostridium tyrobutyricum TaxID=1519 RepID=UPI0018AAA4FC|nr:HK97 family phage prohead protease [Clostridium tyrobutyricum]